MTEKERAVHTRRISGIFQRLETDAVTKIAKHIGKVGKVTVTDTHRLRELSRIGRDVEEIERSIAEAAGIAQEEVSAYMRKAAEQEYNDLQDAAKKSGGKTVPFRENDDAQTLLDAAIASINVNIKSLSGLSASLSGTTGFKDANGVFTPLSNYYQNTVDYAVMQVRTGQADFYSAMRGSLRAMADHGLQTNADGERRVSYNNADKRAYSRRLDSSVRNAVSGGLQRLGQQYAQLLGESFGADGMEISWHPGARPSHVDFAGQQYNMKEYEEICVPLLNDYNCMHHAFPILLGISSPSIPADELERLNAKDAEEQEFEGRGYNAYEARQMQRRMETAIRKQKDRAMAFKASGDKKAERTAKAKATALNQKYRQFSQAMGIKPASVRASVSGYTRGGSVKKST